MKIIVIFTIMLFLLPLASAQIFISDNVNSYSEFYHENQTIAMKNFDRQLFSRDRFAVPDHSFSSEDFYVILPSGEEIQLDESTFLCPPEDFTLSSHCTFSFTYEEEGTYLFGQITPPSNGEIWRYISVDVRDDLGIKNINENTDELEERTNDLEILMNSFIDAVVEFIEGLPKGLSGHWGGFP